MIRHARIRVAARRRVWRAALNFVLLACLSSGLGCSSSRPSDAMPGLVDLKNHPVDPFQKADAKAIVFIFVGADCPISNRYAPEIQRMHQKYASQGISFWLVYPDPDATSADIARHEKEYQLALKALRDPRHVLVKRAGVRVTPEAAVFTPDGREIYHGRIDDRTVDFGKDRPEPNRHDLEEALDAVLNGRPVPNRATLAVGCYISELP
jgi:hypothetical protein